MLINGYFHIQCNFNDGDSCFLGDYSSQYKAFKVIDEIQKAFDNDLYATFQMPRNGEVKE